MNWVLRILIITSLVVPTGCAYFKKNSPIQNRDKLYLSAKSTPPLRIPPGLSSDAFESSYPVSDREYSKTAQDVKIIPPGLI
jgi:uncharacterized lipoprotein